MNWEELKGQKKELFELHKKLIALRKTHPALRMGEFFTHYLDPKRNVYSYTRRWGDEEVLIVLNNSANLQDVTISAPEDWSGLPISDLLSGEKYSIADEKIRLSLHPYSGAILLRP